MAENVILTTYFTGKEDPQRGGFTENNSFEYIRPWHSSVSRLGLTGVIFHDRLSEAFVKTHSNESISFVRDDGFSKWDMSCNDYRFVCYLEYLKKNPCEKVFMTDASDVTIVSDPFEFIEPGKLCVGLERGKVNRWKRGYPRMLAVYGELGCGEQLLLNAGIIGGPYALVLAFLDDFVEESVRNPDFNNNMKVLNYLGYTKYKGSLKNGGKLNSRFKKYEVNRTDVLFIHK